VRFDHRWNDWTIEPHFPSLKELNDYISDALWLYGWIVRREVYNPAKQTYYTQELLFVTECGRAISINKDFLRVLRPSLRYSMRMGAFVLKVEIFQSVKKFYNYWIKLAF
jgi:hypothetical protein